MQSPQIVQYRNSDITPLQAANLMMRYAKQAEARHIEQAIAPIVESYELERNERDVIFSTGDQNIYKTGLKKKLEKSHGIYIFYDSRGSAIYAGKAKRQNLWTEINLAFNRPRGEVQKVKRVKHPTSNKQFVSGVKKSLKISPAIVKIKDLASYVSVYEIPSGMIDKLEALIIRAFANDLLNIKMENF